MGEDSCRNMGSEKKPSTTPPHQSTDGNRSAVMSTCSEESEPNSFGTTDDDKEQELEYGPGIVNKLRTRFLSITMMQQNRGLHRSNMRRSCSLENLLEQDRSSQSNILAAKEKWMSGVKSKSEISMWGNLKRAKSMDTLLLNADEQIREFPERSAMQHQNGSVVENDLTAPETLLSNTTQELKLVKRKEGILNRTTLTICDDELPKPDTVKIYKRMFEPAECKRGLSHSNVRRRPPVLRASAKSGTAIASKQSIQQIKVINASPNTALTKGQFTSTVKPQLSAKEPQVNGLDKNDEIKSPGKSENGVSDVIINNIPSIDRDAIATCNGESIVSNGHDLNEKIEEITSRLNVRAVKETLEANSKPCLPLLKIAQPKKKLQVNGVDESIVKKSEELKVEVEAIKVSECIPELVQSDTILLESKEITPQNSILSNGIITNLDEDSNSELNLGNDTILLNGDYSVSVSSANKVLQSEVSNAALPPSSMVSKSLWQQKPPSNGGSNSVVFDFRGKDVISHLSVLPAPFGCKALRKRSLRIDGKEAVPYTNGHVNGSAASHDSTQEDEDEDVYEMDYSVPLPSGVVFEGENVVVGKGAILTIRNKSLKIQFVDDEDDTFVYPSESSLLEEPEMVPKSSSVVVSNGSPISECCPVDECNDENNFAQNGHSKLRSNTSLGNTGGLTTYTPSVLRTVNNFEPGMFRPLQTEAQDENEKINPSWGVKEHNGESIEEEMLKPADPEFISSWSLSASTSDLLF